MISDVALADAVHAYADARRRLRDAEVELEKVDEAEAKRARSLEAAAAVRAAIHPNWSKKNKSRGKPARERILSARRKSAEMVAGALRRRLHEEHRAALAEVVLRREELRRVAAEMRSVPASGRHRGVKSAPRPIPEPGELL